MPFVDPAALTIRPQKILVAGTSVPERRLSPVESGGFEIEHTELDSLFHGPGWIPLDSFETEVRRFSSEPAWVTEWQYGAVRRLLAERADLMLWLDLPRRTVMRQVITRTVRRRLQREVLWNRNMEPPLHTILFDPDHVVRWAWRTDGRNEERMATVLVDVPSLPIVRLRSREEIEAVLEVLGRLPSDRLS
ncbi:AAA family ATPase [Rhodococcus sp. 3Y1]